MAPREKDLYFPYREGYDLRELRLGSLIFEDFANPTLLDPFRPEDLTDDERAKWTISDQRPTCYMLNTSSHSFSIGGGLLNMAELNLVMQDKQSILVVGTDGSKTEISEPRKFLNEVILKSSDARAWLSIRLSVSRKLQILRNLVHRFPKVWLLTGIYIITDAKTIAAAQHDQNLGTTVSIPVPDPTLISTLLNLAPGGSISQISGNLLQAGSQIMGKRVWAGRFQRLDVENLSKGHDELPSQIPLLNIFSGIASRGDTDSVNISLSGDFASPVTNDDGEFDREYWAAFRNEVSNVQAQIDGDE